MTLAAVFLLYVALQRGVELVIARRNTRDLITAGAKEHFPRHDQWVVAVHAGDRKSVV